MNPFRIILAIFALTILSACGSYNGATAGLPAAEPQPITEVEPITGSVCRELGSMRGRWGSTCVWEDPDRPGYTCRNYEVRISGNGGGGSLDCEPDIDTIVAAVIQAIEANEEQ